MKINVFNKQPTFTFEGGKSSSVSDLQQLKRVTMACLLWENTFYVDGKTHVEVIKDICGRLSWRAIAKVALECHESGQLRHVPLLLICEALKKPYTANEERDLKDIIARICSRPDQITELLALWWAQGSKKLPMQLRKGIALALANFDEYQLAKYNRDTPVKLRDAAFLTHIKAGKDKKKGKLYADLVNKTAYPEKTLSGFEVRKAYDLDGAPGLKTPDTWEVRLSSGADKKESFTELLQAGKMGTLAIVRNLRNMMEAGVDTNLIGQQLMRDNARAILPFQFLAAAKFCPQLESMIDAAMIKSMQGLPKLKGNTILLVDVSGSMNDPLTNKSEMKRMDAASGLAILLREVCEKIDIFSFSNDLAFVPNRQGMALRDAILQSQPNSGTNLFQAIAKINMAIKQSRAEIERIIVITDEQTSGSVPVPDCKRAYVINVGTYQNGIENKLNKWERISGFSENTIKYIQALEEMQNEK